MAAANEAPAASHAVFDLHANRTLAHLELRGGLLLPAGAPGFAKYVHFSRPTATWRLRQREEGKPVALVQAQARLDVPLTAAQASAGVVYLRLKAPARSSVKIAARGQSSAAVALQPGWQLATVKLPQGALKPGENSLFFTFAQVAKWTATDGSSVKGAAAVEWIQLGGAAPPADAPVPRVHEGDQLALPGGGGLSYFVQVPPGGSLVVQGSGEGCALDASLHSDSKKEDREVKLDGTPADLSGLAGEVVRLALTARGGCAKLLVRSAQLHAQGPAPQPNKVERPRNVLVWLTDDTRADRYRFWNPRSKVETPVLAEFDKRATRFQVHYVQGNESRVSHASLFTGLYPLKHGFTNHKAVLDKNLVILPEVAKSAGLYTIGHIANGYISRRWGFGDGWDFMRNHIHEGGGLKGADLVQHAGRFLGSAAGKSKPFFLYLGTIDAHVSWRAYEPWTSKYDGPNGPYRGPFVRGCMDPQLDLIVTGKLPVTDRDRQRIRALYDSDISYNDQQFGAMLDLLKQSGHLDDTMIVFTSDHGEEFWEHGRIGHGQSLRQELVHVPLWIYYPPLFPPGKVVEEGVEVLDVLPTIADALQVKVADAVQGESLVPLAAGVGAGYPRPAIASQYELAHTMRLGRWKLWVGGTGDTRLHDAQADLGEDKELQGERPVAMRFVSDALSLWMAYQDKWRKTRWGVASNHRPELPADLEK